MVWGFQARSARWRHLADDGVTCLCGDDRRLPLQFFWKLIHINSISRQGSRSFLDKKLFNFHISQPISQSNFHILIQSILYKIYIYHIIFIRFVFVLDHLKNNQLKLVENENVTEKKPQVPHLFVVLVSPISWQHRHIAARGQSSKHSVYVYMSMVLTIIHLDGYP